ncbi:oligosaccharide flippase family protein [Neptuniibacter sp. CAU 1671]|uniref:lipopolysaccharide biosynthesis protein n=1 Tax=Neptuniibacter sp. CAU 1671 TaxID=3032593 RepID=UPI0023D9B630|nr:oligosaccharide flippase family protein [Neptuniibacter sp. CAU 1671]MDF2181396.1 oligosaccharide flippase family protein [Neptuniibacter sp. CAU 1671]
MEGIKRALAVSIFSKGWSAALSLLAVPIYLQYLGVEAYGVVGLFTTFTILVAFLDFGLGVTLTRELAGVAVNKITKEDGRDILRTCELVYFAVALMLYALVFFFSQSVAEYWLQADTLSIFEIANSLALAGIALAIQWPSTLYAAGLTGMHKQFELGIATTFFSTVRVFITVSFLYIQADLKSFFYAQVAASLIQTLTLRWILWKCLELKGHWSKLKMSFIKSSLVFAGGMTGISISSIVITQMDKVILSKVLSLEAFGVYVISATLATGLYVIVSPFFSVIYPRFSTLLHTGDAKKLQEFYHTTSQAIALLVMPISIVLIIYSKNVLFVWTGDKLISEQGGLILSLMVFGNLCNGIMNVPYAMQLASGWTKLALTYNIFSMIFLLPAIWWAATNYGGLGGAAMWALCNFFYLCIAPHIMHRRLLKKEKNAWYFNDVILPILACCAVFFAIGNFEIEGGRAYEALMLILFWLLATVFLLIALPRIRYRVFFYLRGFSFKKS